MVLTHDLIYIYINLEENNKRISEKKDIPRYKEK